MRRVLAITVAVEEQ